jgi:hypothetical protein
MKSKILIESLLFSTTYVLSPVLILGGIGYGLDYFLGTNKVFLLSAVAISFVVTQVLMFKKISSSYAKIASHIKQEDSKSEDNSKESNK